MPFAIAGVLVIVSVIVWLRPHAANADAAAANAAVPTLAQVAPVIEQRCHTCHGAQVQMKNIRLDSEDLIRANAQNIYQQVVVTRQMPMNNATGITEDERALIKRWFLSL